MEGRAGLKGVASKSIVGKRDSDKCWRPSNEAEKTGERHHPLPGNGLARAGSTEPAPQRPGSVSSDAAQIFGNVAKFVEHFKMQYA